MTCKAWSDDTKRCLLDDNFGDIRCGGDVEKCTRDPEKAGSEFTRKDAHEACKPYLEGDCDGLHCGKCKFFYRMKEKHEQGGK